jgi:hypothetical protein
MGIRFSLCSRLADSYLHLLWTRLVGIFSRRSNFLSHWNSPWVLSLVSIGGIVFISKKEKAKLIADIVYLRSTIQDLSYRIFQLEGWIPVGKGDIVKNNNAYKWVKAFENPEPKKRGRPVGSKNKEKV